MKTVPLLDLTRQYQALKSDLDAAVLAVCESQQFILGPAVGEFECEAAEYCRTRFALGVSSGTDALILALMALDIGPGDEVITSAYSFFATAGSIARVGAKPVFVDIDPVSFNLRADLVENAVTSRTKAIMPVHLFGQCAQMDKIGEIAKAKGLAIIEDAAQAIGAEFKGKRAGQFGGIGCFSFFPSKNLGAFGDAGLVTTDEQAIYETLKKLRVHGSRVKYYHEEVGGNFRLDSLQAAVLKVKLKYLDEWSEARGRNAAIYRELFTEKRLLDRVVLPEILPDRRHIFNQYVIRVQNRDAVMEQLKKRGVGCEVYYPLCLHEQKCFSSLAYRRGDFPEAERAARESLAIPIFPELTEEELHYVVQCFAEV
jgi:dTDP-4-amino-4,6-dideoxygalactose transaminase